jgi:hypothetical protein
MCVYLALPGGEDSVQTKHSLRYCWNCSGVLCNRIVIALSLHPKASIARTALFIVIVLCYAVPQIALESFCLRVSGRTRRIGDCFTQS